MTPHLIWTTEGSPPAAGKFGIRNADQERLRASELELRSGFFRESWEVSGAGQLHMIATWLGLEQVEPIRVTLRLPDGEADAGCSGPTECWCTAVLHDIEPMIPEVVRLTWVLATAMTLQLRDKTTGSAAAGSAGAQVEGVIPAAWVAAGLASLAAAEVGLVSQLDDSFLKRLVTWWRLEGMMATSVSSTSLWQAPSSERTVASLRKIWNAIGDDRLSGDEKRLLFQAVGPARS